MIDKAEMGIEELVETLTGYEEQTIEQRWGASIEILLEERPTNGMRALAMVVVARDLVIQDVKDPQGKAYDHVMKMTLKQVGAFFPEDEHEAMPDDPDTESGKDGSGDDATPSTKPPGA